MALAIENVRRRATHRPATTLCRLRSVHYACYPRNAHAVDDRREGAVLPDHGVPRGGRASEEVRSTRQRLRLRRGQRCAGDDGEGSKAWALSVRLRQGMNGPIPSSGAISHTRL
jgi:hypothetical protein